MDKSGTHYTEKHVEAIPKLQPIFVTRIFSHCLNFFMKKPSILYSILDAAQTFDKVWHPGLVYKIFLKFSVKSLIME